MKHIKDHPIKFTKSFTTTAIETTQNGEKYFYHFGIHPISASLYGDKPEDIIQVKCTVSEDQTEHKPPDYWGWFNNEKGWEKQGLIQPSHLQFGMCFPYGYKVEEKAGKGKAYRLDVEEIK